MKRALCILAITLLAACSSVPDTLTPEQAAPALKVLLNAQIISGTAPADVNDLQVIACEHTPTRVVCDVSLNFRGQAVHRRAAFLPFRHDSSRFAAIWMPQ
jgi:hypothetical protein